MSVPSLPCGCKVISWNGRPPTDRPGKWTLRIFSIDCGDGDGIECSVGTGLARDEGSVLHAQWAFWVADSRNADVSAAIDSSMRSRRELTSSKRWILDTAESTSVSSGGQKADNLLPGNIARPFLRMRVGANGL